MAEERKKIYYGWIVTVSIWLVYFLTASPPAYGISVITTRKVTQYGWSENLVSSVTSCRAFAFAVTSFFGGFLIRRFGVKKCMVAGNLVSVACLLCIFFLDLSETAYAMMFLGIGIGYGMSIVGSIAVVNGWFSRRKSLPMSVMLTAGAAGGVLMPLISETLCQKSIRLCWGVFIGFFVLSILIVLFAVRNRPEDIGEVPDGRAWIAAHPVSGREKDGEAAGRTPKPAFASVREVLRSRFFYLIALIMLINRMLYICFTSYIILYSVQSGIDSATAAAILSAFSVASFVSRILCGSADRLPLSKYFCFLLLLTVKIGGFLLLVFSHSVAGYMTASLIIGFVSGFSTPLFPLIVSSVFGDILFSRLYGIYNSLASLGSTVTPLIIAAFRAGGCSFETVFLVFSSLAAAVVLLTFLLRPANAE